MKGLHVMAFDVTESSVTIDLSKVELACLAGQLALARQDAAYLSLPKSLIAFTLDVKAQQVPAFQDAFIFINDKF